jgi:hypothetical protein
MKKLQGLNSDRELLLWQRLRWANVFRTRAPEALRHQTFFRFK